MTFDPDTEERLGATAWLVNSAEPPDQLREVSDLESFFIERGYTGRLDRDESELNAVRACRATLRQLLCASQDEAPELINAVLRDYRALPQLVRHPPRGWHIHAVEVSEPFVNRLLLEAALAMSVVVISDECSRISTCAASACEKVVIDLTRNRTKRFCSPNCGNRTAVAAYRARNSNVAT